MISTKLGQMSYLIRKSKASKHLRLVANADLLLLPYKDLRKAYQWLQECWEELYVPLHRARKLVTEPEWEYYDLSPEDFKNHAQVIIWNKAAKAFRDYVKNPNRPYIFRRSIVNAKCNKIKKAIKKAAGNNSSHRTGIE